MTLIAAASVVYEKLNESQPKLLYLDREEAAALRAIGRDFAKTQSVEEREEELEERSDSSVLECVHQEENDRDDGKLAYKVTVWNRIGVIQLGNRTLLIEPKISFDHFVHVAEQAVGDPRIRFDPMTLDQNQSFKDLMARWFLNAVEPLIPDHLIRDYYEQSGVLPSVRGSIDPIRTTKRFFGGRLDVVCRYDVFDLDHPLNRVLKEACLRVANFATLSEGYRRMAQTKAYAMSEVGTFSRGDLAIKPDRRALFEGYGTPLNLAWAIIANEGRSISEGKRSSYAFLQYTPSIIEDGLRKILKQELGEIWQISKRPYDIHPLKSATPDLVFSQAGQVQIVGDVKYKNVHEWGKLHADVYQSIYFATAAEVRRSLIFAFTTTPGVNLPQLRVGKNSVDGVIWDASEGVSPVDSRRRFVEQVRLVLSS